MKKENFILLTEVSELHSAPPAPPNKIINLNCISTIYENGDNQTVIVMNHLDYENENNFKKNYPKRIVVNENFATIKKLLGF